MTQCPICNFECPYNAHKCECCDYELSTPPDKETSSSCATQATPEAANSEEQPQFEDDETPDGSTILGICTLLAGAATILAIVSGIVLVFRGHPIIGILSAVIGGVYNAGLFIVFDNVNDMIAEKKMPNNRLNPISGSSIKLPEKD